jgi:hypothetical protein
MPRALDLASRLLVTRRRRRDGVVHHPEFHCVTTPGVCDRRPSRGTPAVASGPPSRKIRPLPSHHQRLSAVNPQVAVAPRGSTIGDRRRTPTKSGVLTKAVLLLVPMLIGASVAHGQTSPRIRQEARLDDQSIHDAALKLRNEAYRAVRNAGGDLRNQHIRLVLGFSTGHFGSDPLRAQAARQIAFWLLKELPVVSGDRVWTFAYEMATWRYSDSAGVERELAPDAAASVRDIYSHFPLTSRAGTEGGHDSERAIAEIVRDVSSRARPSDYLIVLLTNDAASVNPRGEKQGIWGEDDPRYLEALESLDAVRTPSVNKSGASVELPFTVLLPDQGSAQRELQAVIVRPRHFEGMHLAAPRSGRSPPPPLGRPVASPSTTSVPPSGRVGHGSPLPLIVAIAVLAALGLVLAYLYANRTWAVFLPKGLILEVADSKYALQQTKNGAEICHLAGPGYPDASPNTVTVQSKPGSVPPPPRVLARLRRRGNTVVVRGESQFKLDKVDEARIGGNEYCLRPREKRNLVLRGEHAPKAYLPPQEVPVEVAVALLVEPR